MSADGSAGLESVTATIGRMAVERTRWRVVVETWPDSHRYHGRLVFHPEGARPVEDARASAPLLTGSTPEEVVIAAYELSEKHIRALLRSLT